VGDLIGPALISDGLEMISVDGGAGLLAALPTAYPGVPVQRSWAHKIGNVVRKGGADALVLIFVVEDGKQNAVHCGAVGEDADWSGAPSELAEASPECVKARSWWTK
jgi:transposase-like protein